MVENRTEAQSSSRKMIRVDLTRSLQAIGLPLIRFEKDGQTLRFLLDTGASMNLIKKEVLAQFRDDAEQLSQKMEYYGIDNVCHETHLYSFRFKLGNTSTARCSRRCRTLTLWSSNWNRDLWKSMGS